VVNSEPSSAGWHSAMFAASASATTFGSGSVRRDRGVFGTTRCFPSGLACHCTRTVRRKKSTSSTRKASSSATRNPSPACAITIARQRAGITSASACTCEAVNGTIRSRSDRGRLTLTTGLEATSRSRTAAAGAQDRRGRRPHRAAAGRDRTIGCRAPVLERRHRFADLVREVMTNGPHPVARCGPSYRAVKSSGCNLRRASSRAHHRDATAGGRW